MILWWVQGKTLSEYGVAASDALDFVLEATEESIVKQLVELLKTRDLTCDELGLLYCYKHGVSTNQALKTIGIDAKSPTGKQNDAELAKDVLVLKIITFDVKRIGQMTDWTALANSLDHSVFCIEHNSRPRVLQAFSTAGTY